MSGGAQCQAPSLEVWIAKETPPGRRTVTPALPALVLNLIYQMHSCQFHTPKSFEFIRAISAKYKETWQRVAVGLDAN